MKRRRNNKGMATWLKWVLGLFVVGLVLCLATCGIGAFFIYDKMKTSVDPAAAKKVAASIATIKELPEGYKYSLGVDMMVMTIVAIKNESNGMAYMLIKMPNKNDISADEFVAQMAKEGVPSSGDATGETSTIEVKEKGETTVGGLKMPYIVGLAENKKTGAKQPAFLGCVMPSSTVALMICAASADETKPLNIDEVKSFLTNIESIKKE